MKRDSSFAFLFNLLNTVLLQDPVVYLVRAVHYLSVMLFVLQNLVECLPDLVLLLLLALIWPGCWSKTSYRPPSVFDFQNEKAQSCTNV